MTEELTVDIVDEVSESDVVQIAALLPQLSSTAQFDPELIRSLVGRAGTDLFIARSSAGVVGMATLATFPLVTGWRGIVEDVVVDESHRGLGVARRLLEALVAEAGRRQLRTLDLTSRPGRDSALRLYEAVGFERRETNVMRLSPPSN